jgi:hypothetical protein
MKTYAAIRKAKDPAYGWVVTLLGQDLAQRETKHEARVRADEINTECADLTTAQVREKYKLGHAA